MQHQIISNSLTKIVIIANARFILGVDVLLQSHSYNKVKGQTKRGGQIDKRTGTGKEKSNKYLH